MDNAKQTTTKQKIFESDRIYSTKIVNNILKSFQSNTEKIKFIKLNKLAKLYFCRVLLIYYN